MSQSEMDEAALLNGGTAAGLYKFLDIVIERNEIAPATGANLRGASKKVLEVEKDESLDLRTVDLDDLLRRFHIKSKVDLNDTSRSTYETRFRKAVEMYLKFLDNDPSWKPTVSKPKAAKPSTNGSSASGGATTTAGANLNIPTMPGMIEFPIPLRPGVHGRLILPDNLTQREAKKVVAVVTALASEEQLAITAGSSTASE